MKTWSLWFVFGICSFIGAGLALANPFVAAITVAQITGLFFVFAGGAWIVSSSLALVWRAKIIGVLIGSFLFWIGYSLLSAPGSGIFSLAMVIGLSLAVIGLLELILAFQSQKEPQFWPLMISALISATLSILVFFGIPAATTLAVLLAIQLAFIGVSMVAMSVWFKKTESDMTR